jgi:hypothetical protein
MADSSVYTGETSKIYRSNRAMSMGAVAVFAPVILIMALIASAIILGEARETGHIDPGSCLIPPGIVAVGACILWYSNHAGGTTCLILHAKRLRYESPSLTIETTWDNVEAIVGGPVAPQLRLRRKATTSMSPLLATRFPSPEYLIPLYPFDYSPHCELAQDLRRFAPHLFT